MEFVKVNLTGILFTFDRIISRGLLPEWPRDQMYKMTKNTFQLLNIEFIDSVNLNQISTKYSEHFYIRLAYHVESGCFIFIVIILSSIEPGAAL